MHSTVPRPNTLHKYLMLQIAMNGEDHCIRFLDFLMFMTDSLRNIGKAFKLDVLKGDFPHRFSNKEHVNYIGRLPSIDAEEDWYGFNTCKDEKEVQESKKYWTDQGQIYCTCNEECTCTKQKWDFKKELESYCWKDVYVLAGAVKAYRDQALNFNGSSDYQWQCEGIEPYQYMTQSQIALALFLEGKEIQNISISHEKIRPGFNPLQIEWMEQWMEQYPEFKIQHAANNYKEYYDSFLKVFLDGYCPETKTAFKFRDCLYHACPTCYPPEKQTFTHPRGISWKRAKELGDKETNLLHTNLNYNNVAVMWECKFLPKSKLGKDHPFGQCMQLRDAFYGGRTEVFAAYANQDHFPEHEMLHHDVCSLYPYVCSWKDLPIGYPEVKFNKTIEKERLHPNHPNKYFGFARIKVKPNSKDLIAVLPHRGTNNKSNEPERLLYDLNEKVGCWHTEMIYLAIEQGYEVLEIYEVWHWDENNRSNTVMRGYMEFFLRMKQEAEGWEKLGKNIANQLTGNLKDISTLTDEDKDKICNYIFTQNGGFARPRKEKVEINPVLRQLAKIFLNCLWGKLVQKAPKEFEKSIYGYKQYLELLSNPYIDRSTIKFRQISPSGTIFKARYTLHEPPKKPVSFLNVPIASSVTAHAQVVLMRQMFKVGPENVLYCDTDSIMFMRKKGLENLSTSGLGNWEDEHPKEKLTRFWALAPKCYMIEMEDKEGELDYHLKCKGVRGTKTNKDRTSFDNIHRLIEADFLGEAKQAIVVEAMTIHPNSTNAEVPYGTLCTRYGDKIVQTVFSKRKLSVCDDLEVDRMDKVKIVRLLPEGYEGNVPGFEKI